MRYNGTIYRPPVAANAFLLPVTEGCTHNSCRFCSMYMNIPFRMLPPAEMEDFLKNAAPQCHALGEHLSRVYLVGAVPFALACEKLKLLLALVRKYIPEYGTITMYAAIRNIMTH